jgi:hypothetical protein
MLVVSTLKVKHDDKETELIVSSTGNSVRHVTLEFCGKSVIVHAAELKAAVDNATNTARYG